jgi:hypothetical protein
MPEDKVESLLDTKSWCKYISVQISNAEGGLRKCQDGWCLAQSGVQKGRAGSWAARFMQAPSLGSNMLKLSVMGVFEYILVD